MPELSIIERAQKALSIEHTEAQLKAMAKKSADVKVIKDDTDYQLVKSSRINLKSVRVSIQKAGKAARDDANKFSKAVIAEEKRLINIISPEEARLAGLQIEVDSKAAREAEENRLAEESRVKAIIDRIEGIKETADGLLGAPSGEIMRRAQTVNEIVYDEETFGEYIEQAREVGLQAYETLTNAYASIRELEDQKAKQERVAKEQADKQAKMDAEEANRKAAEDDRLAEIKRREDEVARKEAEIEADRKAEEDRKLEAERAEAEKVRMEKERLEQEQKDREAAEIKAAEEVAEAERQEALRPEKDQLIDWLKKLRFIDGVELHDKKLSNIQKSTISGLAELSVEGIQLVENA